MKFLVVRSESHDCVSLIGATAVSTPLNRFRLLFPSHPSATVLRSLITEILIASAEAGAGRGAEILNRSTEIIY